MVGFRRGEPERLAAFMAQAVLPLISRPPLAFRESPYMKMLLVAA
jgi:hypothetical protein